MNREQIRTLARELRKPAYAALLEAHDYDGIADTLNARESIPNPAPRQQVPNRFTWNTFLKLLSGAEIWMLYGQGDLARDLRTALETNDAVARDRLWGAFTTVLDAATVTKVVTEFTKTIPDPDWQPTLTQPSAAQSLGLPTVRPVDVLQAAQIEK